jgi:hypothetical protein
MRQARIKPEFIDILNRFDNDIDLLRQQCAETCNDPESSIDESGQADYENKFKMLVELNSNISYTIFLPFVNYYKFRKKCMEDGYSMQEGFSRLVEAFVEDKLVVKEG